MTTPPLGITEPIGPHGAPLLVLAASLGTSSVLWENVAPTLAERYRVTVVDMPGHGSSAPVRERFTLGEVADAVAAAVAPLADGPVLFAGVSLGGAVGLELLLRHPGTVRAAAIIASGARLGEPEAWHDRAAQVRAQSTSILITGSAERWFAPGSIARNPGITGRLLHVLQDTDDESYALCCEALAEYDVRALLGEVAVPVLALAGARDEVTDVDTLSVVAEGVQDGRLAIIEDAAHLPPADEAVATTQALLDFFHDVERGRA